MAENIARWTTPIPSWPAGAERRDRDEQRQREQAMCLGATPRYSGRPSTRETIATLGMVSPIVAIENDACVA